MFFLILREMLSISANSTTPAPLPPPRQFQFWGPFLQSPENISGKAILCARRLH